MARRYLITTAAAFLVFSTIIAAACALIDPYGVVYAAPKWDGFNATKVARTDTHRVFKFYDALAFQPNIVVFGSSRINKTFDPALIEQLTGKRAYNIATDGGPLTESASIFRQLLDHEVPIEHAVFELYYWRVIERRDNPVDPITYRAWNDYPTLLFSATALRDALITVIANSHHADMPHFLSSGLFSPPAGLTFGGMEAGFKDWWDTTDAFPRIKEEDMAPIHEIRSLCARYGVTCQFVITPIHIYRLVFDLVVRGADETSRFKRLAVAAADQVEDFSVFDAAAFHRFCTATTEWYDPGHFSLAYGNRLVRTLFGDAHGPATAARTTLTPKNIDIEITKQRDAILTWWAQNPDFARLENNGMRDFDCKN
jgi:hypothetical protein